MKESEAKDKYVTMTPDTTLAELVAAAANVLVNSELNSLDFDIQGMSPDGPIVLHFEATIRKSGNAQQRV